VRRYDYIFYMEPDKGTDNGIRVPIMAIRAPIMANKGTDNGK
jgi:hypothetical protein